MTSNLLALLTCPSCGADLGAADASAGSRALACARCGHQVPIVSGIPRFVHRPDDAVAQRTQASFGYEWSHFNDWRPSGDTNFNDYFEGLPLASLGGQRVLDAGCGMGRHARQVARFAGHVVAVDFSAAIEQAARNTATLANVDCIQADLLTLPLADGAFDLVYSLGVLHHLDETERALSGLVAKLKPGGRLRIYLYWKKHGWQGRLLTLVNVARRLTIRLPFGVLRALCWMLSLALWVGVVLPFRLLSRLGVTRHQAWPLFIYTKYPFRVLYNDQFDRFSAPIEKRYDPEDVRDLLRAAGLGHIEVRPCYGWLGDGIKPA